MTTTWRLGIDIGTSKAAAVLVDEAGQAVAIQSAGYKAAAAGYGVAGEQDAEVLIETALELVRQLPQELRKHVGRVGVTNQMHGIVWADEQARAVSPLINWQDSRCETAWLQALYEQTGYRLHSGYGAATAACQAQRGQIPPQAKGLGTIGDLLVMRLTGRGRLLIDCTNAASVGFYHQRQANWDYTAWQKAGIHSSLLPEVTAMGAAAGQLTRQAAASLGLPQGIAVAAAVGDQQASLLATLTNPAEEIAVTLGTGGQVAAVLPADGADGHDSQDGRYEFRPFTEGSRLLTGCCLGGGAAWQWLEQSVQGWLSELGLPPLDEGRLYDYLNRAGFQASEELIIQPHFWGERYAPHLRGAIEGLGPHNFNLGTISRALARGIARYLRDLLPDFALAGRKVLVGSGNGLRRNELLRWALADTFGMELRLTAIAEEAAVGAALNGDRGKMKK